MQCETCGKEFIGRGKRFCSRSCYDASRGKFCVCETCGKDFKTRKRDTGRFCSRECHYASGGAEVECRQCHSVFKVHPGYVDRVAFCSRQCREASVSPFLNENGILVKTCTRCQQSKSVQDFYSRKQVKSGLESWCKQCEAEKSKLYQQTEKARLARKRANRTLARRYRMAKHSALRRGLDWNISRQEYERLSQKPCHYCGQEFEEAGSGLDRKNNGPIYDLDSVVRCCGRCNTTFMTHYSYEEKLLLAETIRRIDQVRSLPK